MAATSRLAALLADMHFVQDDSDLGCRLVHYSDGRPYSPAELHRLSLAFGSDDGTVSPEARALLSAATDEHLRSRPQADLDAGLDALLTAYVVTVAREVEAEDAAAQGARSPSP